MSSTAVEEKEVRHRKASEPPPSLQVIFDHDMGNMGNMGNMGSSRRWMSKQVSADIANVSHPKQHSLDSTQLRTVTPQSPKYERRRNRFPSTSDKNSRLDTNMGVVSTEMKRAPSTPDVNVVSNNLHVQLPTVNKLPLQSKSIVRAHSTLQLEQDGEGEKSFILRSSSFGKTDKSGYPQRWSDIQDSSSFKRGRDLDLFASKETLKEFGLKKSTLSVSRESLQSGDSESITLKEMPLNSSLLTREAVSIMTSMDTNKDNRERIGLSTSFQSSLVEENVNTPINHCQVELGHHSC